MSQAGSTDGSKLSAKERLKQTAATHTWAGAATIPLTATQARTVDLRAALMIKADTRVQVLDAYCTGCRRNWEACAHLQCPVKDAQNNDHLRGGPIGERRRYGKSHPPMPEMSSIHPPAAASPPRLHRVPAPSPARLRGSSSQPTSAPVIPQVSPPRVIPAARRRAGRRHVVPAGQLDLFADWKAAG